MTIKGKYICIFNCLCVFQLFTYWTDLKNKSCSFLSLFFSNVPISMKLPHVLPPVVIPDLRDKIILFSIITNDSVAKNRYRGPEQNNVKEM